MRQRADGAWAFGSQDAGLVFEQSKGLYSPAKDDLYWKIAVAVPNIELACRQLGQHGIDVRGPRQFEDVGYLAHFDDPAGFSVEIIEHTFQGFRPAREWDEARFGGGACLNLLTLRTHDINREEEKCRAWGMTPLCIQPLPNYGFTLHFFAFTNERPPNPDLTAVENRTWVYQRPYTVLEFQEVHEAAPMRAPTDGECGYALTICSGVPSLNDNELRFIGLRG